jgi:hypothetical protein
MVLVNQKATAISRPEYYQLLFAIVSNHLRGPSYKNQTGQERIRAYLALELEFFHWMLSYEPGQTPERETLLERLQQKRWKVTILSALPGFDFLTSDNPAHVHIIDSGSPPVMMSMPISPNAYAIAYDSGKLAIGDPTALDMGRLNRHQLSYCRNTIYSSKEVKGEELDSLRLFFEKRTTAPGFIGDEAIRFNTIKLRHFEFVIIN